MNATTANSPAIEAVTPCRIESAPSEGPTVRSSRYTAFAGSAPDRRISDRSSADCLVKLPLI